MFAVDLPVVLQRIIDARLDNIERALMTRNISRSDRHQILSAIEDQIMEMLQHSSGEAPSRDEVLSILAKLDPPEAYLEFSDSQPGEQLPTTLISAQRELLSRAVATSRRRFNVLAVVALGLFLASCLGSLSWWMLAYYGLIPLAILALAAEICGIVALCQILDSPKGRGGLWMAITACSSIPVVSVMSWVTYIVLTM